MRGLGYGFCALLVILCIILILAAAAFGSRNTVSTFGANIYLVQTDGIEGAPKGSAVFVTKVSAYDLSEKYGKLVLYANDDEQNSCSLGYVRNVYVVDGIYYLTVSESENSVSAEIPETRLIGLADKASVPLGAIIGFIKTPFGVFCMAVLPCIALILFDVIRAAAAKLPDPEVEPQLKNRADEERISPVNIAVKSDGKAVYSRKMPEKANNTNGVLYNYSVKSQKAERPIIPLTNKTEPPVAEQKKRVNPVSVQTDNEKHETAKTPENVGISRYIKNNEPAENEKTKTAEIPQISKKNTSDAFFTQTNVSSIGGRGQAPQIGRQIPHKTSEENPLQKTSGKRSSSILASKRVDDLIADDDDTRDKNRINDNVIDDIIAGLKK